MKNKFPTKYIPARRVVYIHSMPEREWYNLEFSRLGPKRYKKKYLGYMKMHKSPIRMGSRAFEAK